MKSWGWPQYVFAALTLVGIGISLANHGKPRTPESFWRTLFAALFELWLLKEGGFF